MSSNCHSSPDRSTEAAPLQVELLEQSFNQVRSQLDAFSREFYHNLFTDYPQTKQLFTSTDMVAQSRKLSSTLTLLVENLRSPNMLTETLGELGSRHLKYGVLPEHYPLVGNSLLKTFEQILGSNWTPEVKHAWLEVYGTVSTLMLAGVDHSKEAVALEIPEPVRLTTATIQPPEPSIKLPHILGGLA